MTSVLAIGEDNAFLESLREHFKAAGYRVDAVGRSIGVKTWLHDNGQPSIAILDCEATQLGLDGTYQSLAIDLSASSIPVIALLHPQKGTISNAYQWAQDFVVKPFVISELLARVRRLLARASYADDTILRVADLELDRACCRVRRGNRDIDLSPIDFRLLEYLMQVPGKVFSREELIDAVWGGNVALSARAIDVHIGRLRKALKFRNRTSPVRTVRGIGCGVDVSFRSRRTTFR